MIQRNIMKPWLALVVLGLGLAIVGCNRQADPTQAAASNASPTTAALAQTPAQTSATQREPETAPTTAKSPQVSKANIPPGRYGIGSTDQALDVEGEQYRYLDAEVTQPWRSASELQMVKAGVIDDGKNYWCLSTMAPKSSGAIACSKEGWNQAVSHPSAPVNRTIFLCATSDGKHIELNDLGKTIQYSFGEPGVTPELELRVPRSQVANYQWSGFGRNMTYSVTVPNGNVSYRVFWSLDKLDKSHTPESGVEVIENDTSIATVNCQGEMVNNLKGFAL